MPDYTVRWEIDVFDADSPEDAARKALAVQRDPSSTATVFDVRRNAGDVETIARRVDLEEVEGEELSHDPPCADCGNLEYHAARYTEEA